ncbi:MAG: PAS domain-containing protein [Acidovorax sp.]|nr:PAS domain-containing protein [Acidovorax sp.]
MSAAPLPPDESRRLGSLERLQILDTPAEDAFDALVEAAAAVTGSSISLISLVDADRQWFKANLGLPGVEQTPREVAFCAHAILGDEVFEVPDATADPRFADNALVTGQPDIRFYAGAPLTLGDGTRAGTLCVIDQTPRQLTGAQRDILRMLSRAAVQLLEGRRALMEERALRAESSHAAALLADSEARYKALSDVSPLGVFATDLDGLCSYTNERWQSIFGLTLQESLGQGWGSTLHPDDRAQVIEQWQAFARSGTELDMEFRVLRPDGSVRAVRARARPTSDLGPQLAPGYVGSVEDVTDQRATERALQHERWRLASILEGTDIGTWEWNVQTGEMRVDATSARKLGYTLDELTPTTGEFRRSISHPDDVGASQQHLKDHLQGRTPRYESEVRLQHKNGHYVWIEERGRIITRTPDGKPQWLYGVTADITERKMQALALQRSQELLSRTGAVAGVGGWELELATRKVSWSPQTRKIHGVADDYEPELATAIHFYAPEARPVIEQAVAHALAGGSGWDLELPFIRANGEHIWVRTVGSVEFSHGTAVRVVGAFQDVTRLHNLTARLTEQHELMRVTLQSIGDAVITTDARGVVTWLNPVAERMTGWSNAEALGQPITQVFHILHGEQRTSVENPVLSCLETQRPSGLAEDTVLVSRDGTERAIEDSAAPIRRETGEVLGAVLVFHDVTEQRRLSGEMTYRATHDSLTGLLNRTEFEHRLQHLLASADEHGAEHALLFLDLDQFKLVNDACGHSAGDQLLQQVSRLLTETVRSRDALARLGGDEFAVLLERCPAENAVQVAQKICDRIDEYRYQHDNRRFRVGASIGLVPLSGNISGSAAALQAADAACYAAKEGGRNRVHVWVDTDTDATAHHGNAQWATRIEQALDEDRFVLFAQRIHAAGDAASAMVLGEPASDDAGLHCEILLRMLDGDGSIISPALFIPAAERFHLASRMDRWVLRHTVNALKALPTLDGVHMVCINLSGQSIGDRAFHRQAAELLTAAGQEICQRLCLEITETAAITNLADAAVFIGQMRHLGVRIALDDFGAGASSFSYLKNLRVDILKIDGHFIRDLVEDPLDDVAVRCFVDLARVLNLRTVAEFVHNAAVLRRVHEIGIHDVQGFFLHRPEPLQRVLQPTHLGEAAT